jgi:prephenate dehydrogenase
VAVVGTGLIGTSIAMAAARAGDTVRGFDTDAEVLRLAAERSGLQPSGNLQECVGGADVVFVCTPVGSIPAVAAECLAAAAEATVTDVGSVKSEVLARVRSLAAEVDQPRFVGGHPMGGSERTGPDSASPSLLDDAVWVLTPGPATDASCLERLEGWVRRVGARPVRMGSERHDRLVAVVSHLPQVASTALMGLAAAEGAGEPELLLLAAGGFRDLTRLAASSPALWRDVLLSNREALAAALDRYSQWLGDLGDMVREGRADELESALAEAKRARLALAAKPSVKAGVALLLVPVPDRPGALAELTSSLAGAGVNIEDLQIVHSPEGGRGTVHLTVAAAAADAAERALAARSFPSVRLA